MAEEKIIANREDIIKIEGELRLIHQKLDNHITHMSAKIDTIFKIVWTVSFMVLGLLLRTFYIGLMGQGAAWGEMYGILSLIGKKYGKEAMRRVLSIAKQYPKDRHVQSLKNETAYEAWYPPGGSLE